MAKLNASRNPTFNTEMEAMERTTPGHYSEWNKRHQQLLDNDQYLKDQKDDEGFSVVDICMICTFPRESYSSPFLLSIPLS